MKNLMTKAVDKKLMRAITKVKFDDQSCGQFF